MADAAGTSKPDGEDEQKLALSGANSNINNANNQNQKLGKLIARMLQADSEVGAVPNVTASCIARAVAQFVERLVKETQGAARGGKRKIDASHMYVDAYIYICLILTPRPCDGLASRHRARRTLPGQHIPLGGGGHRRRRAGRERASRMRTRAAH